MARNENPRAIQQRLVGFMPPEERAMLQSKAMAKKKG
jgi:chemotaxis protein MotA